MGKLTEKGGVTDMPKITDEQYEVMKKTLGLDKRKFIVRNQYIGANKALDELVVMGWASMHTEDYLIKKPTYFLSEQAKRYTYDRYLKEETVDGKD